MPYICVNNIITNRHPLGLKAFIQPITFHQTLLVHKQPIILTNLESPYRYKGWDTREKSPGKPYTSSRALTHTP